jgi:hypothetical protein
MVGGVEQMVGTVTVWGSRLRASLGGSHRRMLEVGFSVGTTLLKGVFKWPAY